ncbi:CCG-binding protein 1 [Silene latifolia]|uniref:CCG-binding protein 1 n=1 Tax=Silene latifolia TaxID=37657 RepID=UPI003D76E814
MIVGTLGIPKSPLFLDPHHHHHHHHHHHPTVTDANTLKTYSITCCSKNHDYKIPKLEPFSRTKFERGLRDPPLIDKSQNQLADYCTLLEGEPSYSCWQAYFELKDLQKEYTKDQLEKLIIEAGGVKSLIGCLHGVSAIHKANKSASSHSQQNHKQEPQPKGHIPDGLPKTTQELEEEENSKMPDSAYTRLLRLRGTLPAWYSPAPN